MTTLTTFIDPATGREVRVGGNCTHLTPKTLLVPVKVSRHMLIGRRQLIQSFTPGHYQQTKGPRVTKAVVVLLRGNNE